MSGYSMDVRWSQEDEGYVAVCPEFDGVSAFGSTRSEAVAELEVAVELAAESYAEESWALPAMREHVAHSGQFRVRLPRSLHEWLAGEASRESVSLNTYVVSRLSEARGERGAVRIASRVLRDWQAQKVKSREYHWTPNVDRHVLQNFWPGPEMIGRSYLTGTATEQGSSEHVVTTAFTSSEEKRSQTTTDAFLLNTG